jgi:glycosyltransferase involved in cell wall biosynthesis
MTQPVLADSTDLRSPAQGGERPLRVAFVTNFCPHYRVKTFELLAKHYEADFLFYSDGNEWYWQQSHGMRTGQFRHQYLRGITVLGTRITPSLVSKLWRGNYDAIVTGIDGRFALAATFLAAHLRRRPLILWTGIWSAMDTPFHRLVSPLTRYIYRRANAIVTYGEHVKRYLIDLGVAKEKIFIAPHAVDNQQYASPVPADEIQALREKLGLSSTDRVVLYLGRLEEIKGLTYLLEAFCRVATADAVLVLAGDGSERQTLQRLSVELGIEDRVRFSGYVPPENTLPYYSMAHALVLPSITTRYGKELWGLVVNEAMNQGVPIIASDAVGAVAGGLVRNGENGFVVPQRNPRALAHAIQMILDSADLRKGMSCQALQIIGEWDNEQMVGGFRHAVDYVMHKDDPLLTSP